MIESEWLKELPPDFRPSQREIDQAYGLFGERNGVRPDLRILVGHYDRSAGLDKVGVPDRKYPTLRIIIDDRLCLFFYGDSGKWEFDGYECGNYENYWTEFDWMPHQKGKRTMIGWLVGKFSDKAIKKIIDKYLWKAILSIMIFAVALCATLFGVCEMWVP